MRARFAVPLGADFSKLWTSTAVSNLGDGVTMVAGPLLVASLSPDPAAVAGAAFAQQLPWLLFALISGAWADRLDRRRLVATVNVVRGAAVGVLAIAVASGSVGVPLILIVCFVLGTGETLADTASAAFVPALVPPASRPRANSLLYATFNLINQFAAKPLGAWLFVVAAFLPFGLNALTFGASALLVASIRPLPAPSPSRAGRLSAEIAEGVRFLFGHRLLRTLAVTMAVANLVFCAAFAIFVLYAMQRLGLSDVGYGVLLLAFAAGGLLGTLVAPRLLRAVGASLLLRLGLLVEVALHATLALTTTPLVAASMIVIFGIHTTVWGVVVTTIRQRDIPAALFGRVTSVYSLIDLAGAAAGSLAGGLFATAFGLTATYAAAAAAMLAVAVVAWHPLRAAAT
ncbi:MFS transporter [Actinoplanes sp. NPDC051343]|uniref:MFS transporter n=1 Tax=Actinoplanes sp. NPDC051343 TaxID=3363906 RepID=UPI0037999338